MRALMEGGGDAAYMTVTMAARCLVVMLGPDIASTHGSSVAACILSRTADVLAMARGLMDRIAMFRCHTLVMVLFKVQVVGVPGFVTAILLRSLQRSSRLMS